MKQKILFYGNCQVGTIARFFRLNLSDEFEVQLCTDCGLKPFWNEPGLFAVWSTDNRENQKEYVDCMNAKIKESDIFVFQPHDGGKWLMNELKTEYLYDCVATKQRICLPDTRIMVYLLDKVSLAPYVEYVKTKVHTSEEIINYLQKSDDPELVALLKNEYPFSTTFKRYRNENRQRYEENLKRYDNVINMCDYIERDFNKKLLAVSHNHMAECYYVEMLKELYKMLNVDELKHPIADFMYPGQGVLSLDPRQFSFFTKVFPDFPFEENYKGRNITVSDIS